MLFLVKEKYPNHPNNQDSADDPYKYYMVLQDIVLHKVLQEMALTLSNVPLW